MLLSSLRRIDRNLRALFVIEELACLRSAGGAGLSGRRYEGPDGLFARLH
jgi:hypothetical protein